MNDKNILMVGNGINYVSQIGWNQILDHLLKFICKDDYENEVKSVKGLSSTLLFEYICNKCQEIRKIDNDEAYKILKDEVSRYIQEKCNFIRDLWDEFDVILTTNFDNTLDITAHRKMKVSGKKTALRSNFTYNKNKKRLYYMHGSKDTDNLCFGFGGYSSFVNDIHDYVNNNYKESRNIDNKQITSWIDYFFRKDQEIHVFGFGFAPEEIDIWTILEKRKKLGIENIIKVYDIWKLEDEVQETKRKSIEAILCSFGIEYIGVGEEENLKKYNSDLYPLILKKIREGKYQFK